MEIDYEIDDELHRQAKAAAAEIGITFQQFLEDALAEKVERVDKDAPRSWFRA